MAEQDKDEVVQLYLDDIIPNRFQPREVFDERALKELAVSIKEHGVIQPIIVRNVNGKYEIIAGERRYKASALAGQTKIPAIIRDLDDKESSKVALLENLQRKNLNAIEEARTYQKILEIDEMTQEELAKTMGKSQSAVANKIRLLSLPDEIQDALLKEKISERHARALLNIPTADIQKEFLQKVINEKMSVRKLEEEINEKYPKPKKAEEIAISSNETTSANEFLNNQPLMPTTDAVEDNSANYGKVVIAPPIEEENNQDLDPQGNTTTGVGINNEVLQENNQNKSEEAKIISPPPTSDIDGLLNTNSTPLTPAEKIVKEEPKVEKKSDDYFQMPDLTAIQIPQENTPDEKNTSESDEEYNVNTAIDKIHRLIEELKSHGIKINADEMDFPKSYQVILKIEKDNQE